MAKIHAAGGAQQREDALQLILINGVLVGACRQPRIRVPRDLRQFFADFRRRHHHVDHPGGNRRARHAVEFRRRRRLREGDAAGRFHLANADGAVRCGARQHHRNTLIARHRGQRREEVVDRCVRAAVVGSRRQYQRSAGQHHLHVGRNHVHVIRLNVNAVGHFRQRHRGVRAQQVDQRAVVMRRQVLHQHHRQTGFGVERLQ